jgi:hypothetical protein
VNDQTKTPDSGSQRIEKDSIPLQKSPIRDLVRLENYLRDAKERIKELELSLNLHRQAACENSERAIKAEAQNKIMREVLEMVEDNSKMPHQHSDLQTRLYCLAERAREALSKNSGYYGSKEHFNDIANGRD